MIISQFFGVDADDGLWLDQILGFNMFGRLSDKALNAFLKKYMKTTAAKRRTEAFARYLRANGHNKRAYALEKCAMSVQFHKSPDNDFVSMVVPFPCGQWRICQICAVRRMGRYAERFKPVVIGEHNKGHGLYFCTLTTKDDPDLWTNYKNLVDGLAAMFKQRRNSLSSGCRNTRIEFSKVLGAIVAIEVKRGSGGFGWHTHAHLILSLFESETINPFILSKEWNNYNGGVGSIVDVRPLNPSAKSIKECIKYPIKIDDMPHNDIYECWKTLKGKRMLTTFGCFRGITVPEIQAPLPLSGDDTFFDDEEDIDLYSPEPDEFIDYPELNNPSIPIYDDEDMREIDAIRSHAEINPSEFALEYHWSGDNYLAYAEYAGSMNTPYFRYLARMYPSFRKRMGIV